MILSKDFALLGIPCPLFSNLNQKRRDPAFNPATQTPGRKKNLECWVCFFVGDSVQYKCKPTHPDLKTADWTRSIDCANQGQPSELSGAACGKFGEETRSHSVWKKSLSRKLCVHAWVHGRGCDCLNLTQLFCLSQVSLFEPWWMDTYRFPKASTRKKVCKTALPSFHVHLSDSPGRIMWIIPWLHCENNAYPKTNNISPILETWVMRKMIWPTKFY